MRDVSWKIFASTGNIEAYLLYKECRDCHNEKHVPMRNRELPAFDTVSRENVQIAMQGGNG